MSFNSVFDRNHADVLDGWMGDEEIFHLLRINIFAATVEHVIGSTKKKVAAIFIHAKKITGGKPAITDTLFIDLRQVVVSRGNPRIPDPLFPLFLNRLAVAIDQFHFTLWPSDTTTPYRHLPIIKRRPNHHRPTFRQAVTFADRYTKRFLYRSH
jgi:hypothetical protein